MSVSFISVKLELKISISSNTLGGHLGFMQIRQSSIPWIQLELYMLFDGYI